MVTYGPYAGIGAELDAQWPIARDRFGIAVGAGAYRNAFEWGHG